MSTKPPSGMTVLCLGTGGFFPIDNQETACYMIPEIGVIFDMGTGFTRTGQHVQTDRIDIFMSHAHNDHIIGIPYLDLLARDSRIKKIVIHGEQFVLDAIKTLLNPPYFNEVPPNVFFEVLTHEIELPCGAIVYNFPLKHTCECRGYRLYYNRYTVSYVTDTHTTSDSSYMIDVDGSNLLLHECYYTDEEANSKTSLAHTSPNGLINFCKEANIHRLVVIHHDPMKDTQSIIDALKKELPETIKATDNLEIKV